jgi:hypothetical protein
VTQADTRPASPGFCARTLPGQSGIAHGGNGETIILTFSGSGALTFGVTPPAAAGGSMTAVAVDAAVALDLSALNGTTGTSNQWRLALTGADPEYFQAAQAEVANAHPAAGRAGVADQRGHHHHHTAPVTTVSRMCC